ncbi:hypothetical protein MOTE_07340 [Moorella thermoacetica]|uniref:Sialidase domain-containing protein n=1 Tax=Neomoorella thermoacetica TaxID=1525 RepID=A0A1J5NYE6_NEOTH|nr:hypothetical protein MOTE_07340 [Moorella thermoacetica]
MFTSLIAAEDSWQLVCSQGILRYRYTATGRPMANLLSYKAAIDRGGCLHVIVTLTDRRLIYARWRGNRWERSGLPVKGSVLDLALDTCGKPHLLLSRAPGTEIYHLYRSENAWRRQVLPFRLTGPPLVLKPLPRDRLFLAGHHTTRERGQVFLTVYSPTTGWQEPRALQDTGPEEKICGYWYQGYLYFLSWRKQEPGYGLYLNLVDPDGDNLESLYLGTLSDPPDDQPVLLGRDDTRLFLWTSSSRLAFCFSRDRGRTWSPPQSAYFFFPARIKRVEGPDGPSTWQVAFTKINGLELDWPLLIDFNPLFSLCKAVLVKQVLKAFPGNSILDNNWDDGSQEQGPKGEGEACRGSD